ncbi:hypothetical protein ACFL4G_01400 [Thermodesulfobacteriota bacterium]
MPHKIPPLLVILAIFLSAGCTRLSGTVMLNGAGLEGVTVTLSGPTTAEAVTDYEGRYVFEAAGLETGTYIATPDLEGYDFTPAEREFLFSGESVAAIDFEAEFDDFMERRFDEVAFATTHNAMANAEDGWLLPNQRYSITRQLNDGVRGLMLDIHKWENEIVLCHGCEEWYGHLGGYRPLADGLTEIRLFLEENPDEVVTIIFESYVSRIDAEGAFVESGLFDFLHAQSQSVHWPTLGQMAAEDRRVVVLTSDDGLHGSWYHPVWSFAWETDWSNEYPSDFTCDVNRGHITNDLFILNHFLSRGLTPKRALAKEVNENPFFIGRAMRCFEASGKIPNFVTVDHYDIGDVFHVVNALNALRP